MIQDSSGRGSRRGERSKEDSKEREESSNPGPTSMVVSWVGRYKARANLNDGELDFKYALGTVFEGGKAPARANLNGEEVEREKRPFTNRSNQPWG